MILINLKQNWIFLIYSPRIKKHFFKVNFHALNKPLFHKDISPIIFTFKHPDRMEFFHPLLQCLSKVKYYFFFYNYYKFYDIYIYIYILLFLKIQKWIFSNFQLTNFRLRQEQNYLMVLKWVLFIMSLKVNIFYSFQKIKTLILHIKINFTMLAYRLWIRNVNNLK